MTYQVKARDIATGRLYQANREVIEYIDQQRQLDNTIEWDHAWRMVHNVELDIKDNQLNSIIWPSIKHYTMWLLKYPPTSIYQLYLMTPELIESHLTVLNNLTNKNYVNQLYFW